MRYKRKSIVFASLLIALAIVFSIFYRFDNIGEFKLTTTLEKDALQKPEQQKQLVQQEKLLTISEKKLSSKIYYYGASLAASKENNIVTYYHSDYLGSTRTLSNVNKNKVSAVRSAPFGSEIYDSSNVISSRNNYKFTGQESDASLYYYGARYYSPENGRFTQLDPVLSAESPYAYVSNNPLRFTDPNGMQIPEEQRRIFPGDLINRRTTFGTEELVYMDFFEPDTLKKYLPDFKPGNYKERIGGFSVRGNLIKGITLVNRGVLRKENTEAWAMNVLGYIGIKFEPEISEQFFSELINELDTGDVPTLYKLQKAFEKDYEKLYETSDKWQWEVDWGNRYTYLDLVSSIPLYLVYNTDLLDVTFSIIGDEIKTIYNRHPDWPWKKIAEESKQKTGIDIETYIDVNSGNNADENIK